MPPVLIRAGRGARATLGLCADSIARTFPAHRPLYVCSILFCGMTLALAQMWHVPLPFDASLVFIETLPMFLALGIGTAAAVQLLRLVRRGEDGSPVRNMLQWLYAKAMKGERPGNVFHSLVTLTPLMIAFSALKEKIPEIHPFAWDQTFVAWDRALFFGHLPWEILQPILGHPAITAGINFAYDFWFVIMFGALLWQAFAARGSVLRTQFLLAYAFAWFIGGNLLAVVFSSAGPCFYGHLYAHDPFAAQMVYLHDVAAHWPVWSMHIQDLLWQSYADGSGRVAGISAMPSMHVTVAVLVALLGWRTDRRMGAALWIFAGVIMLGSVHLAWHYAVDSFAGAGLAVLFWQVAGLYARADARLRARITAEPVTAPA